MNEQENTTKTPEEIATEAAAAKQAAEEMLAAATTAVAEKPKMPLWKKIAWGVGIVGAAAIGVAGAFIYLKAKAEGGTDDGASSDDSAAV